MFFRQDPEDYDWFYVNRQIDDCAEHFRPCDECRDRFNTLAETGEAWFPGQLCGEDYTALECLWDAGAIRFEIIDRMPYLPGASAPVASQLGNPLYDDRLDEPPSYIKEVWIPEDSTTFFRIF